MQIFSHCHGQSWVELWTLFTGLFARQDWRNEVPLRGGNLQRLAELRIAIHNSERMLDGIFFSSSMAEILMRHLTKETWASVRNLFPGKWKKKKKTFPFQLKFHELEWAAWCRRRSFESAWSRAHRRQFNWILEQIQSRRRVSPEPDQWSVKFEQTFSSSRLST